MTEQLNNDSESNNMCDLQFTFITSEEELSLYQKEIEEIEELYGDELNDEFEAAIRVSLLKERIRLANESERTLLKNDKIKLTIEPEELTRLFTIMTQKIYTENMCCELLSTWNYDTVEEWKTFDEEELPEYLEAAHDLVVIATCIYGDGQL